jgi:ABC-type spermidine/putrescine transport system permease subunit I
MNPRLRATLQIAVLVVVIGSLVLFFPKAYAFVEMAARELRYFWWLVFILALALWLIFGLGRKRP